MVGMDGLDQITLSLAEISPTGEVFGADSVSRLKNIEFRLNN